MARKNYLYLGLALACFLGIILVFFFDGYVGVYDSLVMDNGLYEQRVEPDQWRPGEYNYLASIDVERDGRIDFTYTVENHRFTGYESPVEVSLYHGQDKVAVLLTDEASAAAFGTAEITWSLEAASLLPADYPENEPYNAVVVIIRGEVNRQINIGINSSPYPIKTIIVPPE